MVADFKSDQEYLECIQDLLAHEKVRSMRNYIQHGNTDCLTHCLCVSYNSYRICRRLGFDARSAARGALLHDFFLYDWHNNEKRPYKGMHGFQHPRVALQNADRYFVLNEREKNIICRHMWPLTPTPPKSWEAYVVSLVDKYCSLMETAKLQGKRRMALAASENGNEDKKDNND